MPEGLSDKNLRFVNIMFSYFNMSFLVKTANGVFDIVTVEQGHDQNNDHGRRLSQSLIISFRKKEWLPDHHSHYLAVDGISKAQFEAYAQPYIDKEKPVPLHGEKWEAFKAQTLTV